MVILGPPTINKHRRFATIVKLAHISNRSTVAISHLFNV